jgi:non-ribosomal peptide synthetase-like protein
VACGYIVLVFVELVAVRWLVRGRQLVPGTYPTASLFYVRKWFTDRVMDASLDILHPVYATLYAVPFLRAVGVQIGHGAEVSTARGINELSVIGDEAFIADAVLMGDSEIRGNKLTLKVTTMEPRSFAGNASLLPAGTTLGTGSLVGVLSLPPAGQPLEAGTSCFGSPAVLMPRRQELSQTYDDKTLFSPTPWLRAQRLFIEGLRIVLPRIVIVYGLGFGVFLFEDLWNRIGWAAVATLPIFYFFLFALPAVGLTILAKWILVGAYRPDAWPLWSLNVWLSEAVTSTFETLAERE